MDNHLTLLGGKLQLYRRGNSRFWQCSASVGAKQYGRYAARQMA